MSILGIGRSFKECFGIGKKEISSTNSEADPEAIFDNDIGKYFKIDKSDTISKERLIGILNEITKTTAGQNILKALKSALGEPPARKIAFNICDSLALVNGAIKDYKDERMYIQTIHDKDNTGIFDENIVEKDFEEIKKFKTFDSIKNVKKFIKSSKISENLKEKLLGIINLCAFNSADALDNPNAPLVVIINKDQISEERYVFDGEKIKTQSLAANEKTEAYLIAHELAHVVSFLNSKVENRDDWNLRKGIKIGEEAIGWVNFFKETDVMREVYHGLLLDGFTPKQIIEAFGGLFGNTEEGRNVLGLIKGTVDEKEVSIGEGQLFKETMPEPEKSNSIITYLGKPRDLTDVEKAVLIVLSKDSSDLSIPLKRNAQAALGDAFKGFDLVNVPIDNSAIEAIKAADTSDTSLIEHDFSDIEQKIDEQVSNYYTSLQHLFESFIPESEMRTITEVEHLSDIAKNIRRPIVLVQSNTEDPLKYTVKAFNHDGKVEEELLNYNLKELKDTEPKPIFLYHNGINHFHALVPNE